MKRVLACLLVLTGCADKMNAAHDAYISCLQTHKPAQCQSQKIIYDTERQDYQDKMRALGGNGGGGQLPTQPVNCTTMAMGGGMQTTNCY